MKSRKVLALMMGAIIASSGINQMAVQVYAYDEDSSSSSYSDEDSIDISIIDSGEEGLNAAILVSERNFQSKRADIVIKNFLNEDLDDLYISENRLVFKPIPNNDNNNAQLVFFDDDDFYGNIDVPQEVNIRGEVYSVTTIGQYAFAEGSGLRNVTLPASITIIDANAFEDCTHLEAIELPENLNIIGDCAFSNCEILKLAELPAGLTEIGASAFSRCGGLELRELPAGLTEIGEYAFWGCGSLRLAELPEGLTEIGASAFMACDELRLRRLPENLIRIRKYTFAACANLRLEEGLPQNLRIIGEGAFAGTAITRITIPEFVNRVGRNAFDTSSIREIILAQGHRLNIHDLIEAIGDQKEGVNLREEIPEQLNVEQRIIDLAELNAEYAERLGPICQIKLNGENDEEEFNEENGQMGAIIASSGMSQMAVQVYADDGESSSSSYLDDIARLDEGQIKEFEVKAIIKKALYKRFESQGRIFKPDQLNTASSCAVCFRDNTDKEISDFIELYCGHYICVDCLLGYVWDCYTQGSTDFRCPFCRDSANNK